MTDNLAKFIDELRSRISISEIVGEKVRLTKRGGNYVGLCPFHNEKTPSFTINESKGFYHCFGCGKHGDAITYISETEGLSFIEAVKKLAARLNMELPPLSKENQENLIKRKSLYEIMDIAADYFEKNLRLPIGSRGLAYFRNKRGLSDDIIKKFRLGYAPNNNGLKALLSSKGISEQDMVDLGLLAIPEDKQKASYDFFHDRVMIPIMDKQNNIIAFGGRILNDGQPKYLNSPETPIFNKRRILYNINNAREPAYNAKRLIICEGYMDVIALDSYNFKYAVAPLGTALTEEQIIEAWKICNIPTLCFDGDKAGIKAALRSIERILPILRPGYSVNYMFLKEKKDPDELLHSYGPQIFEQYLNRAKPLVDILWHKCKMNKDTSTPEQKALIEKENLEEVNRIQNTQIRAYYLQEMKNRIYYTFGKGSVYKENKKTNDNDKKTENKNIYNLVKKPPLTDLFIRKIAAAMIYYPQLIEKYEEKLTSFDLDKSPFNKILNEIITLQQEESITDSDIFVEKIKLNYPQEIDKLWELKMYRTQKTPISDIKKEIDSGLKEIQLKQIEKELKECITLINHHPENVNSIEERYRYLLNEKNKLLNDEIS